MGDDGELRARVRAAPVESAANDALRRLLAESLRLPLRAVRLESGVRARLKVIAVDELTRADVEERWPGLTIIRDES